MRPVVFARWVLALWCLFAAIASSASAETLFGVISERNSATAALAAVRFTADHTDTQIVLRTPRQLALLKDSEIVELLARADTILIAGIFSEDAARLARLIDQASLQGSLFAISSTRPLIAKSRDASGDNRWDRINAYWQARGADNLSHLFAYSLADMQERDLIPAPKPQALVRLADRQGADGAPLVTIFDYDTGDQPGNRDLHDALCTALIAEGLACQSVYADWGAPSAQALGGLAELKPSAIVMLQDFAVGGAERASAEAALQKLDVPVLKGIRLNEYDEDAWRAGSDGLPTQSAYYRVAMPELSGSSQPLVLAAGAEPKVDPISGIEIRVTVPISGEVEATVKRITGWVKLRKTANADKRLALIYYNHPPGRHNIGADNLDVPASLFEILKRLEREGYKVGDLPKDPKELLAMVQQRAVNLPENNQALRALHEQGLGQSPKDYARWLESLPKLTQAELVDGPLAALELRVKAALTVQNFDGARITVRDTLHDMAFVIEGAPVRYHKRAEALLDQLGDAYHALIKGEDKTAEIADLTRALQNQGIEGLRGWGAIPGKVMTIEGDFVFPHLRFGNVLIAPQPPRGWEVNEEVLHANLSVPPTHHYLAFYHWLRRDFEPHALVHLGRHSTYEFLPGKRVGLSRTDYPRLVAGDTPGLYPYIVDGVGEGLQAKRRGLGVIIDHLTPPLQATPLYDDLLGLRGLVESFEAADPSEAGDPARAQALKRIKTQVTALGIEESLVAELEAEHGGGETIEFESIDPDLLVHEVGHFLTEMQENFMPLGLHVFGRAWAAEAIETMLASMGDASARDALAASPEAEMTALLAGLEGRFIAPGKGNDPLRTPEALPTGRNFYGLDASLVPNAVAWDIGSAMAKQAGNADDGNQAVVLWASDTVRDGGVMMAFGLELLGVKPVWNSRGILTGLDRLPLTGERQRQDVTFVASGLFRDLYGEQMKWLDKAVLVALDGASQTISRQYPQLRDQLETTLEPLGELRNPGTDQLADNAIAAAWVEDLLAQGTLAPDAGRLASLRLFGPALGRYSAGVNRLVERSGAWEDRAELAQTYIARIGHAYGNGVDGIALQDRFEKRLSGIDRSYLGRASNLYGLVDNNDAFDYLGGLNLAVETVRGEPAKGFVVDVSDPNAPDMTPLASAILQELRGRQLNPAWISALMQHGYAGARTMNSGFFENLWGWEASDPDLFSDTVWDDAKAIYVDDRYDLGVDAFLDQSAIQPVKANILAIMLVAAQKGYWQADATTIAELAQAFAEKVIEAGLPGSGHTRPDHPMLDWIADKIPPRLAQQLAQIRDAARGQTEAAESPPELIREVTPVADASTRSLITNGWPIALIAALMIGGGIALGRRRPA